MSCIRWIVTIISLDREENLLVLLLRHRRFYLSAPLASHPTDHDPDLAISHPSTFANLTLSQDLSAKASGAIFSHTFLICWMGAARGLNDILV